MMKIEKIHLLILTALLFTGLILPITASAVTYGISIRDVTITPDYPEFGDTINVKVDYRVEGEDTNIKLYLYVDGTLEKTYTLSNRYEGTYYYTFYFDSDNIENQDETKHEITVKAKIYDEDDELQDTDSYSQNIYFEEDGISTTDYNINIQEITVTPAPAHAGDTISIKTEFDISAPSGTSTTVKSYLYIDDHLEKTYTGTYYYGTRYYTFTYKTDDLDKGTHDIKIKQELYRNSIMKDADTEESAIYLEEKRGIIHDLDFTSITYETPANSKESIPITVTVKNSGNTDEEGLKIKLILGSKTVTSSSFYLRSGATATKTLYIETPAESGSHELIISAYNTDVEEKTIQHVSTKGYEISLKVSPEVEAYIGDWIKVSGSARADDQPTREKVMIYIDDIYEKTVMPQANGYYEDYIMFDSTGFHKITVDLMGTRDDKILRVYEKPASTTTDTGSVPGQTEITVTDGEPYTIIIVQEGKERIYVDGTDVTGTEDITEDTETQKKITELEESIDEINTKLEESDQKLEATDDKIDEVGTKVEENKNTLLEKLDELKNSLADMLKAERDEWERQMQEEQEAELKYVDIETSANELVVNRYGANTLSIHITNHLGKKESFSVETDFPDEWVFLPKTEIIDNKETKTVYIYFNPTGEKGYYDGQITVSTSESVIKEIPLKLYVTEEKKTAETDKESKDFIGPDSLGGIILLAILFAVTMLILYANREKVTKKKEKPLEPSLPREPFAKAPFGPMFQDMAKKEPYTEKKESIMPQFSSFKNAVKERLTYVQEPRKRLTHRGRVYHVSWNNVIQ